MNSSLLIKTKLRNLARRMTTWPKIGRLVRIAIAVIRLPETRNALMLSIEQNSQQAQEALQAAQRVDGDRENLIKSVPVTLRAFKQQLNDVQAEQQRLEQAQQHTQESLQEALADNGAENNTKSLPVALRALKQQLNELGQSKDLNSLRDSINYLLGRVEFVRRELIFEMRYGATSPVADKEQLKAKTEIISDDKLTAALENTLRLNLGCGHITMDGYLNVDRRALPGVDIVAEVDELPFEANQVDEIFSSHLLEHFPQEQLRRELLPYWAKMIKPGGVFKAVVPDANSMIHAYAQGTFPYSSLREVTFGAQDYDGDFHFNMFIPEQLSELLKEAGFINFEMIEKGRRNGQCFEMEFTATKKPANE
ncbi:Methyltransferase domain protein [compost metagenome]